MNPGELSRVSNRIGIIDSARESVEAAAKTATELAEKKAFRSAIESFEAISASAPQQASIQAAGFSESPLDYLAAASVSGASLAGFSEIVSMADVLQTLKQRGFPFQNGVDAFLKSGIQEALAGFKISSANAASPSIPKPLNELLTPEKMRTPDPLLPASLQIIKQMFSTLSATNQANLELKASMFQFIRA
ncbi:hypothetical protein L0156_25660 [bacterium]|nr:hypothetical protein [bacterium]